MQSGIEAGERQLFRFRAGDREGYGQAYDRDDGADEHHLVGRRERKRSQAQSRIGEQQTRDRPNDTECEDCGPYRSDKKRAAVSQLRRHTPSIYRPRSSLPWWRLRRPDSRRI